MSIQLLLREHQDIGYVSAKGREFKIIYQEGGDLENFSLLAVEIVDGHPRVAGTYKSDKVGEESRFHDFLDLPRGRELSFPYTHVSQQFRGNGLSQALFDVAVRELRSREAVDIAAFTRDGMRFSQPRHRAEGYEPLDIVGEIPEDFQGLTDWMVKDYREI